MLIVLTAEYNNYVTRAKCHYVECHGASFLITHTPIK
jgi:hypothetical protein